MQYIMKHNRKANKMILHEWKVTNADGDMVMTKRIVTSTNDKKVAGNKLKAMYGKNACFFKLVYVGTFQDNL